MNVYKFGGASVKDAEGIKNLFKIINTQKENLIIVVSAMGKMTDALEVLCNAYFNKTGDMLQAFQRVKDFHQDIISDLFGTNSADIDRLTGDLYAELQDILESEPSLSYDYEYDRIISFGELLSTTIIATYLEKQGRKAKFTDIRKCLITDQNYRNACVNLELSAQLCRKVFTFQDTFMYITQGFIAGTTTSQTTTLGREGSDYTAALLANLLNAEEVTIWKDVPGIMNADPKLYENTEIISKLSYKEAIELSNCGAKVIHPKTIKPLQNKGIPLYVRSFLYPESHGSVIRDMDEKLKLPPIFIDKDNQLLLTLSPRDFSFIAEEKLSRIFATLAKYRLRLNLMQTSAITFSFCIDLNEAIFESFINELHEEYEVLYNKNVRLLTIRHYNEDVIGKLTADKKILVEQRSRLTARFVVASEN